MRKSKTIVQFVGIVIVLILVNLQIQGHAVASTPSAPQGFTLTPSPTSTIPEADTATPTPTLVPPTDTPTPTSAPPTVTPKVGISDPSVQKSVSPEEAAIGEEVVFTLIVKNNGDTSAKGVVVTDPVSSYLYIDDATSTKGTVEIDRLNNIVTVDIGGLSPGKRVTIIINTTVVNGSNETNKLCNKAKLSDNNGNGWTDAVCYKILGSPTLPGTGELGLDTPENSLEEPLRNSSFWVGILGLLTFFYGFIKGARKRRRAVIFVLFGAFFIFASIVGLITSLIFADSAEISHAPYEPPPPPAAAMQVKPPETAHIELPAPGSAQISQEEPFLGGETDTQPTAEAYGSTESTSLKVFLPSVLISKSQPKVAANIEDEDGIDTSPVTRVVIPSLDVDTLVQDSAFDGYTWDIDGLGHDAAWLENTSLPGLGSNTVLAGHIQVRGSGDGPFRNLIFLRNGQEILVYTEENLYTYKAREQWIVSPTNFWAVQPSDDPQLTLLTCSQWDDGAQTYLKRRAVFADLTQVEPLLPKRGQGH